MPTWLARCLLGEERNADYWPRTPWLLSRRGEDVAGDMGAGRRAVRDVWLLVVWPERMSVMRPSMLRAFGWRGVFVFLVVSVAVWATGVGGVYPSAAFVVGSQGRCSTVFLGDVELVYTQNVTMPTTTVRDIDGLGQQTADTTGTSYTWYATDHQGTIRLARTNTTSTTLNYTPYGDLLRATAPATPPNRHAYLNKTLDPTGETRLDHRNYDTNLNILTTPDPLLTPYDPLNHNPYNYARNNPISASDPSGLFQTEKMGLGGGQGMASTPGAYWAPPTGGSYGGSGGSVGKLGSLAVFTYIAEHLLNLIPNSDQPPPGESYLEVTGEACSVMPWACTDPNYVPEGAGGSGGGGGIPSAPSTYPDDDDEDSAASTVRYGPHNPGPLGDAIASTFRSSSYTASELPEATTLYRVYGGQADKLGSYWSRIKPSGPLQSQLDSALNPAWGNAASNVATIRVPAGTTIYEGAAGSQSIAGGGSLLGGGSQVYIPRVSGSWLVP